jgi:hypothetical protein
LVDIAIGQFFEDSKASEMLQAYTLLYELTFVDVFEKSVGLGEL